MMAKFHSGVSGHWECVSWLANVNVKLVTLHASSQNAVKVDFKKPIIYNLQHHGNNTQEINQMTTRKLTSLTQTVTVLTVRQ